MLLIIVILLSIFFLKQGLQFSNFLLKFGV